MAHYQNQFGATPQSDEYGNPIRQSDEFGNPIYQSGGGAVGHGASGGAHSTGLVGPTIGNQEPKLHRSGSSSSSSSEDDGQGGRRKKGMKEKIKEKLPGAHKDHQSHTTATTTPGVTAGEFAAGEGGHEKKGMMDRIKEKLPGHH